MNSSISIRTVGTRIAAGALLGTVLLLMLGAGTAAAKVYPQDMSGTLTVIERSDHTTAAGRTDRLARVRWKLPGRVVFDRPLYLSRARAQVLEYREHETITSGESGQPDWRSVTFLGFVEEAGIAPGTTNLTVQVSSINPRLKRARASIRLPGSWAPAVRVSTTTGLVPTPFEETRSLVSDPKAGYEAGTGALIGAGALRTKASGASTVSPVEVMSATNVLMRYQRGRWRARGQRTIRAHYWDGTPVTYTVKWNLVARQPSQRCSPIPSSVVRGKTVTQVRRIIRTAGFRPGTVIRSSMRTGTRGRVTSTTATSIRRCESRVDMFVRR